MNDQTKTQTCGNCANYSRGNCTAWLPPDDDLMAVKKVSTSTPACPEFLESEAFAHTRSEVDAALAELIEARVIVHNGKYRDGQPVYVHVTHATPEEIATWSGKVIPPLNMKGGE